MGGLWQLRLSISSKGFVGASDLPDKGTEKVGDGAYVIFGSQLKPPTCCKIILNLPRRPAYAPEGVDIIVGFRTSSAAILPSDILI